MKRIVLQVVLLLLLLMPLTAQRSTTYTYTPNPKGSGFFTRTGDAYLPGVTNTFLGLNGPRDLYITADNRIIIADTGNKRILTIDIASGEIDGEILFEEFVAPSGVWVTGDGTLYVADPRAKTVFCFDTSGALIRRYTRPDQLSFGDRDFAPKKIAVDSAGNLFIIGEGLYDGVIQLSPEGSFLGYFTSNKIDLSFVERLQDLFFTDAQKENLLDRSPITFSNLFVDYRNILYTTSIGKEDQVVKKHNTAGMTIASGGAGEESAPVDLWVAPDGIIVAVFADGETILYTQEGDIIATFGYTYLDGDIAGLFHTISSVAIDSSGTLWYLDEEKDFLQSYEPTEYILNIYRALELFDNGEYEASVEVWQDVLKVNQLSQIAHLSIGKNYLFMQDYEKALYHTRIANNREFYSDSYWEIRNIWLQKNIMYIVLILGLIIVGGVIIRFVKRKYSGAGILAQPLQKIRSVRFLSDLLYQFDVMRHPDDGFYYLRKGKKGGFAAASVIIISFFIIFLLYIAGKGFIYQKIHAEDIDFTSMIIGFFGGIFLFILSNYLGTSINDGRGDKGDIYKLFAYSLAPLGIAMLLVTGLSYFLTLNELFTLQLIMIVGWTWSIVLLILGLKEFHEYNIRGSILSILFTFFFMLIIVIVLVILSVLAQQVFQFFTAIIKELIRNVR